MKSTVIYTNERKERLHVCELFDMPEKGQFFDKKNVSHTQPTKIKTTLSLPKPYII